MFKINKGLCKTLQLDVIVDGTNFEYDFRQLHDTKYKKKDIVYDWLRIWHHAALKLCSSRDVTYVTEVNAQYHIFLFLCIMVSQAMLVFIAFLFQ